MKKPNMNEAIRQMEYYIKWFAKRYSTMSSRDDLMQQGYVGVIEAWYKYDDKSDASFKTFAWYNIKGSMTKYITKTIKEVPTDGTKLNKLVGDQGKDTTELMDRNIEINKLDSTSKYIIKSKLAGYTNKEIANKLNKGEETIRRKLKQIRGKI